MKTDRKETLVFLKSVPTYFKDVSEAPVTFKMSQRDMVSWDSHKALYAYPGFQ